MFNQWFLIITRVFCQGPQRWRINVHSWLRVLCLRLGECGGGGGFLNNASCQWSNKDKINPPAERPRPFSDYFPIRILVIARLGQWDVQLMRFTHAGWTRVSPGCAFSADLMLSHFSFSNMTYCASSGSTSVFLVNPSTRCSNNNIIIIIIEQRMLIHMQERWLVL